MITEKDLKSHNKESLINLILSLQKSEYQLKRMKKDELVEEALKTLSIKINNHEGNLNEYSGVKVNINLMSDRTGGQDYYKRVKMYFEVRGKIIYARWELFTPSGYGDNGIRDSFEIKLSNEQIKLIIDNGFTSEVVKNICSQRIAELARKYNCLHEK